MTTINAAGSQLFQQQLAGYNKRSLLDEESQKAEGRRLGSQLTSLGFDPDVDDPGLARIGMAASMAPKGIVGTLIKGVAQVKAMEALDKKAGAGKARTDQLSDMIMSNFDVTKEDALMYARNPKQFEMYRDILKSTEDREDRETLRERETTEFKNKQTEFKNKQTLFNQDQQEFKKEQDATAQFELKKDGYKSQVKSMLIEGGMDDGQAEAMASHSTANQENWEDYLQKVWTDGMDEHAKRRAFKQNAPLFRQFGISSYEHLAGMQKLPPALQKIMWEESFAERFRPIVNDLYEQRGEALNKLMNNQDAAQNNALIAQFPTSMVMADHQRRGAPEGEEYTGLIGEEEVHAHRMLMLYESMQNEDSKVYEDYQSKVKQQLSSYIDEVARVTGKLANTTKDHPSLLKELTFADAEYRDETIQNYPASTFFNFGGSRGMVIDLPDGGKGFVDETDDRFDQELYEFRHGGGTLEDIIFTQPSSSLNNLPTATEAGELDLGAGGTPRLDEEVSDIAKLNEKYQSLLSQASAKGAKEEALLTEDETAFGKGLRNLGDRISNEYSNSLIIPRSMHDGFTGTPYDPTLIDSLKYAGVEDYSRFMYPVDDVRGIDANRTPKRINYEITKELQRRIKLLEKVIKPK